jgi:cytochrome c-type biogenesis protein
MIAAGAGLLSFASPCVVPLVPGYLGYLSGTTLGPAPAGVASGSTWPLATGNAARAGQRRKTVAHALAFVLGFTLVFTALGASVGLIGYAVRDLLPYLQKAGGVILIAFGLHTMGVITLPFLYREMRVDARRVPRHWGYLSSLLVGAIFGAGWTPCVGVVLSGILTMAATSATVSRGATLLLTYSLGLGIPFLLSALAIDRAQGILRRLNRRARLVEVASGALLIVMGLLVFGNVLQLMSAYFYRWFGYYL